MNRPVYITNLSGFIDKKQAEEAHLIISEHLKQLDLIPIKIYSNLINKNEIEIHFHQMLFTYYNIRERHTTVINNWFEKANCFESIYELYFGTIFKSIYVFTTKIH